MPGTNETAKVAVGLDMCYVAKMLTDTSTGLTYETPWSIPMNAITNDSAEEVARVKLDNGKNDIIIFGEGEEEMTLIGSYLSAANEAALTGQTVLTNGAVLTGGERVKASHAVMWRTLLSNGKHRYHVYYLVDFRKPSRSANTRSGTDSAFLEITGSISTPQKEWELATGTNPPTSVKYYAFMDETSGLNLDSTWFTAVPTPEIILALSPTP